jgi:glycosyltransferase involved in cell wall biosynthesis
VLAVVDRDGPREPAFCGRFRGRRRQDLWFSRSAFAEVLLSTVSVCIPCHNEAERVELTIRSVLQQTAFEQIKEIILVDDGSSDNTGEVIRSFTAKRMSLTIVEQKNKGVAAARNRAMKVANGKFIAFLDGDDLWDPRKIELQIPCFSDSSVGLVYSDYIQFESDVFRDGTLIRVRRLTGRGHQLARDFYENDGPILPSAVILRRNVYEDIGGFSEQYCVAEDTEYWMRIALAGYGFCHIKEGLCFKRRRKGSLSHDFERWVEVIEDQTHRFAEEHCFLRPLASRRLSKCYAKVGESLLARRQIGSALPYLAKSLRCRIWNPRAFAYCVLLPLYALKGRHAVLGLKQVFLLAWRARHRSSDL